GSARAPQSGLFLSPRLARCPACGRYGALMSLQVRNVEAVGPLRASETNTLRRRPQEIEGRATPAPRQAAVARAASRPGSPRSRQNTGSHLTFRASRTFVL